MTADLAGDLDRLDKEATPGPWEVAYGKVIVGDQHPAPIVASFERNVGAEYVPDNPRLVAWLRNHTDEIKAALAGPAPCEMTRTEPFDFAQCETHDTTFPLGEVCKFHNRDPWEVLYDEADEQRGLKVRAELERDQLRAAVQRAEKLGRDLIAAAARQRQWTGVDRYNLGVADAKEAIGEAILKELAGDDGGDHPGNCTATYLVGDAGPGKVTAGCVLPQHDDDTPHRDSLGGWADGGDHR